MESQYYTYTYLRKDGSPYYVGKGRGNRAFANHKAQGIGTPKDRARIKLQYWSDEETAVAYEMYQIDFWGRKDAGTGILYNKTEGGEGISGASEETRGKISKALKGRTKSAEFCQMMSSVRKGKPSPLKGKPTILKGRKGMISEETRTLLSIAAQTREAKKRAEGYTLSKELRKKFSDSHKGIPWSPARRAAHERKKNGG